MNQAAPGETAPHVVTLAYGDLAGDSERQVQSLLRDAFPDCDQPNYFAQVEPSLNIMLQKSSEVIAHAAVYERRVPIGTESPIIGMIGGVTVAPEHRRKGYVRTLMRVAHEHLRRKDIPFSFLAAYEPLVYQSSGYRLMENETSFVDRDGTWKTLIYRGSMVAELLGRRWPNQRLYLNGPVI